MKIYAIFFLVLMKSANLKPIRYKLLVIRY